MKNISSANVTLFLYPKIKKLKHKRGTPLGNPAKIPKDCQSSKINSQNFVDSKATFFALYHYFDLLPKK